MYISKIKREAIQQAVEAIKAKCNEISALYDEAGPLLEALEEIDERAESLVYDTLLTEITTYYKEQ